MKVLILSHTRCGSTTLCKWISKELDIELDESPYDKKTFDLIFQKTNIIRKIVTEEYIPSNDVINKFDKVICLSRESNIDTAISFIVANTKNIWHSKYEVSNEWIVENKNKILEQANRYDLMKNNFKQIKALHITYENIYINKSAIIKILNYMGINFPNHLDMLDYHKKYRKDNNVFIKKNIQII